MKIDSQKVAYGDGDNDNCYTPMYGVEPIIKHLIRLDMELHTPHKPVVWCPFDTSESWFVKLIVEAGFSVRYSHIDAGYDYYKYEPEHWDVMISNPPFTRKRQIFERALSFGKPFALLMTMTWLNDAAPKQLFMKKDLQLLMFDNRIKYIGQGDKPTFSSGYYCWNFLQKQIINEHLEIPKCHNQQKLK